MGPVTSVNTTRSHTYPILCKSQLRPTAPCRAVPHSQPWALREPRYLSRGKSAISYACDLLTRDASSLPDPRPSEHQEHSKQGFGRSLETCYSWGSKLASGGNAKIYLVQDIFTGRDYACKCIPKVLQTGKYSEEKRKSHQVHIQNELAALQMLQGHPNVVQVENIFEDDDYVHIIMELCHGRELHHNPGFKAYTEHQVKQIMSAALGMLATCHAQEFLHRDIKPGNFLLAREGDFSTVKAIDFGLAVPFRVSDLPLEDLGLEGTAWYMAPEVLSSKVGPKSDVWSAGIMAAQLLTGRLPFDDFRSPMRPAITKIWQAILCKEVDFSKSCWSGISERGRDFIRSLLQKDPANRLSAKEALSHPWLEYQDRT